MKSGKRIFLLLATPIILLTSHTIFAFDKGDFQYWSNAGASVDINNDWKATFEEEFRIGDNISRLYYHHSDVGFVYSGLADWLDLGFNYKQVYEKDTGGFGKWREEHRPHFNVTVKGKLFGLDVSDRSRIEYRDLENTKDYWRYRNKATVKLPFRLTFLKLQPYLADEVFFSSNGKGFDRNRFYSGLTLPLLKGVSGDIYYMFQSSKSGSELKDINVLGTALRFSF